MGANERWTRDAIILHLEDDDNGSWLFVRLRTSPERRRAILEGFDRSGVSAAEFARLVGIKYSTFAQWVQKRRREPDQSRSRRKTTPSKQQTPLRLLEAVLDGPNLPAAIHPRSVKLQLPGGVQMELSSVDQAPLVAALVKALQLPEAPC